MAEEVKDNNYEEVPRARPAQIFILKSSPSCIAVCWLCLMVEGLDSHSKCACWTCSIVLDTEIQCMFFCMLSSSAFKGMLLHAYACRARQSRSRREHLEHLSHISVTTVWGTRATFINTIDLSHVGESRKEMNGFHLWEWEIERAQSWDWACKTWA